MPPRSDRWPCNRPHTPALRTLGCTSNAILKIPRWRRIPRDSCMECGTKRPVAVKTVVALGRRPTVGATRDYNLLRLGGELRREEAVALQLGDKRF